VTDVTVLIPPLEFDKRAAATKEKERRAREKAKGKAKLVGSAPGPAKVSKAAIRASSLFSTFVPFG
jgi:hypothetical protein